MDIPSVIAENLKSDNEKLLSLTKRYPYYADEIASYLIGKDTLEATDEELELSYREIKEVLDRHTPQSENSFSTPMLRAEATILAAEIALALTKKAKIHTFLPTLDSVEGKCVYFRNAYSDEAYRRFSPYLTSPTASYSDTPMAACRDVYNDLAAFAILPVRSSKEGVIGGMARHISRFELAPTLFCDITLPGSDETMTMGLFSAFPMAIDAAEGMEAILFADDSGTLPALMLSADILGCPVTKSSLLDDTQGFPFAYRLTFTRCKDATLLPLWLLLRCEYPHHQLCGIWRTISKNK